MLMENLKLITYNTNIDILYIKTILVIFTTDEVIKFIITFCLDCFFNRKKKTEYNIGWIIWTLFESRGKLFQTRLGVFLKRLLQWSMRGRRDASGPPTHLPKTFSFAHLLIFNILRGLSNPLMRCFMQKTLGAVIGVRISGAKLNTLVFPNTLETARSAPHSFRGNKKSMFISRGRVSNVNYRHG